MMVRLITLVVVFLFCWRRDGIKRQGMPWWPRLRRSVLHTAVLGITGVAALTLFDLLMATGLAIFAWAVLLTAAAGIFTWSCDRLPKLPSAGNGTGAGGGTGYRCDPYIRH